jgi:hypothetical protein
VAIVGVLAGGALIGVAGAAVADDPSSPPNDPARLITATHLPPLLLAPGEPPLLRYDIYCPPPGADPESGAPCAAAGTVYLRAGDTGAFRPVDLELDPAAGEGRYVARVPPDLVAARDGFSYYAVLRSRTSGATTTLPAAGAAAPMRTRPLRSAILVSLGPHTFGSTRPASVRAAFARWGTGNGEVGLEPGTESQPVGGSSFAVDASGTVTLLDEANRRVLRFPRTGGQPEVTPIDVRGTIADLGVAGDGSMTVLETVGDDDTDPLVRAFDRRGHALGAWHLGDRTPGALRMGPDGPAVLAYPSGAWLPVADRGVALDPVEQRRGGRPGRPLGGGEELVAEREGSEARIAIVGRNGVRRSWRITSETPLGEIQLAEPFGSGVLVVLHAYTDENDEFEVLTLGPDGLVRRFSAPSRAWAETAPLARFRLQGSSLYELGSTAAGVFVDRFDLEMTS